MERIYPVLYILIEILALFISYMLVQIRKKEIAIMRGMGASRTVSFMSLFYEQFILCLAGSLLGLILCRYAFQAESVFGGLLSIAFILCWIAGTALSIAGINRCSVMSILHAEE
jgi:ABC-type antimicrobial peptide transport system permease subunit